MLSKKLLLKAKLQSSFSLFVFNFKVNFSTHFDKIRVQLFILERSEGSRIVYDLIKALVSIDKTVLIRQASFYLRPKIYKFCIDQQKNDE